MNCSTIPHILSFRLRAAALASLFLVVLHIRADARVSSSKTPRPTDEPTALVTGRTIESTIARSGQQRFTVALRQGQYLRIALDRLGTNLALVLVGPAGKELVEFPHPERDHVSVSLISPSDGDFTVIVRCLQERDDGKFRIAIEELRDQRLSDAKAIEAERCFQQGENLRGDYRAESYRAAISKYKQAAAGWGAVGDRRGEATALLSIGETLARLSDQKAAGKYFERALTLSTEAGDSSGVAAALNHLAYHCVGLNELNRSVELASKALTLTQATADLAEQGRALFNIGYANETKRDNKAALDRFERALRIFTRIGDKRDAALCLTFMGVVKFDADDLPGALDYIQGRALPLWDACGDRWGRALALNKVGLIYTNMGERQKALDLQREAVGIFERAGDREHLGVCLNSLGYLLIGMGQLDRAYDAYRKSLPIFQSNGNLLAWSVALARIGKIHELRGEYARALSDYRRYLSLSTRLHDPHARAYILQWMGDVWSHSSLPKALSYYNAAARLRKSLVDPRGQAQLLDCIGFVRYKTGKLADALEHYNKALSIQQSIKDREGESLTLYNIAVAERDSGDLAAARSHIEQALNINEALRSDVVSQDLRASYFASVHRRYELLTDILMQLYRRNPSRELLAAAFESSERARARSILEMLAESRTDIRRGVDPALLETESELSDKIQVKEEARIRLLSAGRKDKAAAIDAELDSLNSRYQAVEEKIKLASPEYAALRNPSLMSLGQVQQDLVDPETALLEYSLGDERSYLWVITHGGTSAYVLPPRSEIEEASKSVYSLLSDPKYSAEKDRLYWSRAARLSAILLKPASSEIAGKRIVVIPDGALQYVPFDSLPAPVPAGPAGSGSAEPMIVDHEIASLPSASILGEIRLELAARKPAPRLIAALADPIFDPDDARLARTGTKNRTPVVEMPGTVAHALRSGSDSNNELKLPPLPATEDEARAIIRFVPDPAQRLVAVGLNASRELAQSSDLSKYRIVVFATHALVDASHPERSGIVLSMVDGSGAPHNGVLSLRDIYNMHLNADLVVLSACKTALGKDIKGEGLVGLTRGFMYAGAARVVSTLWKVDDSASAALMTSFYEKVLKDKERPAAALKEAKIEMWKTSALKSPRYWGAFELQGEWR